VSIQLRYVGNAYERIVRATDFAAVGLPAVDMHWNRQNDYTVIVDPLVAAFLLAQIGEFSADSGATTFISALSVGLVPRAAMAPMKTMKNDAAITCTGAGITTWIDVDPGGLTAARPLDVVIPGPCVVGNWIEIKPKYFVYAASGGSIWDFWTVVAGVPVHNFSIDSLGDPTYGVNSMVEQIVGSSATYQLQAGDINPDGSVRVRLRFAATAGVVKQVACGFGWRITFEGRGPF
jgi:hypothetical protein